MSNSHSRRTSPRILVDADACPVKDEIERLAERRALEVLYVCGLQALHRAAPGVQVVYVEAGPDAADDWLIENCRPGDIVATGDVPLAAQALKREARVIDFRGREMTDRNMPDRLQMRNLMTSIREGGTETRGPRRLSKQDRANFTKTLGRMLDQQIGREIEG